MSDYTGNAKKSADKNVCGLFRKLQFVGEFVLKVSRLYVVVG